MYLVKSITSRFLAATGARSNVNKIAPFIVLAIALFVFVYPALRHDRTLTNFSDAYVLYPWSHHKPAGWFHSPTIDGTPIYLLHSSDLLNRELVKEGKTFAWNPYAGLGAPWLAGAQPAQYFPGKIIAYFWPDYWRGADVMRVMLLLVAGVGNFLLLRSIGVGRAGATFAGLSYMLSERLFMLMNMAPFHIECLMPVMLYAVHETVKRRSIGFAFFAGAIGGAQFIGGFPETSFIFALIAGLFFLVALCVHAPSIRTSLPIWGLGALIAFVTLALSEFQIGEFVRYLSSAQHAHAAGYGSAVHGWHQLLAMFLPNPFGEPFATRWHDHVIYSTFCGISTVLLAIAAILGIRRFEKAPYIVFFGAVIFIFVGYDFGFPLFTFIGKLPLFNVMSIAWNVFVVPFSLSVLAGFGFDALTRRGSFKLVVLAIAIYAAIVVAMLLAITLDEYRSAAVAAATLLVVVPVVAGSAWTIAAGRYRKAAAAALLALVAGESYFSVSALKYAHFFGPGEPPPPSLKWLAEHVGHDRMHGLHGVYPANTLNPYRIRDIRHLDAMYPGYYIDFVEAIWPSARADAYVPNNDTWTSYSDPLLDLAAVRYIITPTNQPPGASSIFNGILKAGQGGGADEMARNSDTVFELGGEPRRVLVQPPRSVTRFATTVPPNSHFVVGLGDDRSWQGLPDGTRFRLTMTGPDGRDRVLLDRVFELKHDPGERRWLDAAFDMSSLAGQRVTFTLQTFPARDNGGNTVTAGWTGLYFDPYRPDFTEVYKDTDVIIYRNEKAVSRARFVSMALPAPPRFAPDALKSRAGELRDTVFLSDWKSASGAPPCTDSSEAKVDYLADDPDVVRLKVAAPCHGYVVLADVFFPGWFGTVDGRATKLYRANYAFRAVEVGAGSHVIEFRYGPWTTRLGMPLALLTAIGLAIFWGWSGYRLVGARRRRRTIAAA